jgi:hypothetical protein
MSTEKIFINRPNKNFADQNGKNPILRYVGWIINALSILAISAHWGGGFMAVLSACILTLILPPIAALFAFFAAMSTWGWPWYLALLVFLWPIVFLILGVGIVGSAYLWMRHRFSSDKNMQPNSPLEKDSIEVSYEVLDDTIDDDSSDNQGVK